MSMKENPETTMISLVSRQIWPQLLAIGHYRPCRCVLVHSENGPESKHPAKRIQRFLKRARDVTKVDTVHLKPVPSNDFDGVSRALEEIRISKEDVLIHLTGGNKLMAFAGFRWAEGRGLPAFYIERFSDVFRFDFDPKGVRVRTEPVDRYALDSLDPIGPIQCQIEASEIERKGQLLVLNRAGCTMSLAAHGEWLADNQPSAELLYADIELPDKPRIGDRLEMQTAHALLAVGVRQVRRSVRLKAKSTHRVSTTDPHAEIDLIFVHGGRLWVVDCKDTADRLTQDKGFKALKEDLLAAGEIGGLDAKIICVRRGRLTDEQRQFARLNGIELVSRFQLADELRTLLFPDRSPRSSELQALQQRSES